jgi:hypothetical protein
MANLSGAIFRPAVRLTSMWLRVVGFWGAFLVGPEPMARVRYPRSGIMLSAG